MEKMKNARRISSRVNPLLFRVKKPDKVDFLLSGFAISRRRAVLVRFFSTLKGIKADKNNEYTEK